MTTPLTKQLLGIEFIRSQITDVANMPYLRSYLLLRIQAGNNGGNLPNNLHAAADTLKRCTKTTSKHLTELTRRGWIRKTRHGHQIVSGYALSRVSEWKTYKYAVIDSSRIIGASVQELTAYLTEFILEEQHKRYVYCKWKEANGIESKENGRYYDADGNRIAPHKLSKKPSPNNEERNVALLLVAELINRSKSTVSVQRRKSGLDNYRRPKGYNTRLSARYADLLALDALKPRGSGRHFIYRGWIYFSPTTVRESRSGMVVTRKCSILPLFPLPLR